METSPSCRIVWCRVQRHRGVTYVLAQSPTGPINDPKIAALIMLLRQVTWTDERRRLARSILEDVIRIDHAGVARSSQDQRCNEKTGCITAARCSRFGCFWTILLRGQVIYVPYEDGQPRDPIRGSTL